MTETLSPRVIADVLVARHLYLLATDQAASKRDVAAFAAVNLFQDSLEAFLRAAIAHLSLTVSEKADFAQMYDAVDKALDGGGALSNRTRLLQINRMRVGAKHHGLAPDRRHLDGAANDVLSFFEDASEKVFARPFSSINLINQIDNDDVRQLLEEADQLLAAGNPAESLQKCRMAFFLEFEVRADIQPHIADEAKGFSWLAVLSAPDVASYARTKEYYDKNVREPFDVIVPDHNRIETELLKEGLDPNVYWNIIRLTPAVYKDKSRGWLVKNDLDKLVPDGIQERAAFVLDSLVDLLVRRQLRKQSRRWARNDSIRWVMGVKNPGAPVYVRADRAGPIVSVLPDDVAEVTVKSSVPGLSDDGPYWEVNYYPEGPVGALSVLEDGTFPGVLPQPIRGYMHDSDLKPADLGSSPAEDAGSG